MTEGCWLAEPVGRRFLGEGTDAFRMFASPTAWVDRFGGDLLVAAPTADDARRLAEESLRQPLAPDNPRVFGKRTVVRPGAGDTPELLYGGDSAAPGIARETGLLFEVNCVAGYSPGLFCDQRANRVFLRRARPRKVLNCFAYTCAFSAAAAAVGAETCSVDLSRRILAWGRRNFEHNGFSTRGHRFLSDDVLAVLPRLARRGERFDAIILDPPTFSRSAKGRVFRVERDFPMLLESAAACAAPGAWMLLSTNCSRIQSAELRQMALRRARCLRRNATFDVEPVPPDFRGGPAATTLWLRLG